ncbi:MAG: anaerobic ribonucleoside-triphosphate reductase activating protein [Minisyncoccus archaeiphilus]|uniref:anaerobic ribonucleoside-triphosphate reductase activating protein n=1 Tax=Minisyncoccus archaeiphilus TaxID=3238481 RepID=UPI002B0EBD7D|nr:MAG: anaerobic ribonucleoside-triphosphate reductase activating protein [Candidatus Parcubacteria bacterium]
MRIGGFQKFSLIDYPGKISCIIFFSGCNFRCPFCYSSELVLPEKIASHPVLNQEKVLDYLETRKGLLEGVVLCGGEPTLNQDLPKIIKPLREMGYSIKLDTNGSNPDMLKKLINEHLIDYVAMDIKAPVDDGIKYSLATGGFNDIRRIKESINLIKENLSDYEFRSTLVPGIHSLEDIILMAKSVGPAKRYYLQQFVGGKEMIDNRLSDVPPFPYEGLEAVRKSVAHLFGICQIR